MGLTERRVHALSVHALTLDVCRAVRDAIRDGERRVHVTIDREVVDPASGTSGAEFLIVEGFACARAECPEPLHVYVHASDPWEALFGEGEAVEFAALRNRPPPRRG